MAIGHYPLLLDLLRLCVVVLLDRESDGSRGWQSWLWLRWHHGLGWARSETPCVDVLQHTTAHSTVRVAAASESCARVAT